LLEATPELASIDGLIPIWHWFQYRQIYTAFDECPDDSGWRPGGSRRLWTAFSRTRYGGHTKSRPHDRNNNKAQTIGPHCVRSTAVGCVRPHSPPRPQKSNLVPYSVSVFQNTAMLVSVFGIFPRLHYFKSMLGLCAWY